MLYIVYCMLYIDVNYMGFVRWFKKKFGLHIREINIKKSVVDDLCYMAQEAHPKEMLAFLSSTRGIIGGVVHIDEIQLQAYDASEDMANVMLSNIPMTTNIVGTVHSHPGGSTRPSSADVHLFGKFGFVHAIIGEPYVEGKICFYDKQGRAIVVKVV